MASDGAGTFWSELNAIVHLDDGISCGECDENYHIFCYGKL
jgi:hypothetical protein